MPPPRAFGGQGHRIGWRRSVARFICFPYLKLMRTIAYLQSSRSCVPTPRAVRVTARQQPVRWPVRFPAHCATAAARALLTFASPRERRPCAALPTASNVLAPRRALSHKRLPNLSFLRFRQLFSAEIYPLVRALTLLQPALLSRVRHSASTFKRPPQIYRDGRRRPPRDPTLPAALTPATEQPAVKAVAISTVQIGRNQHERLTLYTLRTSGFWRVFVRLGEGRTFSTPKIGASIRASFSPANTRVQQTWTHDHQTRRDP